MNSCLYKIFKMKNVFTLKFDFIVSFIVFFILFYFRNNRKIKYFYDFIYNKIILLNIIVEPNVIDLMRNNLIFNFLGILIKSKCTFV